LSKNWHINVYGQSFGKFIETSKLHKRAKVLSTIVMALNQLQPMFFAITLARLDFSKPIFCLS